jgi:hypothetical protein
LVQGSPEVLQATPIALRTLVLDDGARIMPTRFAAQDVFGRSRFSGTIAFGRALLDIASQARRPCVKADRCSTSC